MVWRVATSEAKALIHFTSGDTPQKYGYWKDARYEYDPVPEMVAAVVKNLRVLGEGQKHVMLRWK